MKYSAQMRSNCGIPGNKGLHVFLEISIHCEFKLIYKYFFKLRYIILFIKQ
jgi:hypothetical protein